MNQRPGNDILVVVTYRDLVKYVISPHHVRVVKFTINFSIFSPHTTLTKKLLIEADLVGRSALSQKGQIIGQPQE